MSPLVIKGSLAFLFLVLGFIALLLQKIYYDPKTGKKTAVEIPLIGKFRTNYPALVFVFLSFILGFTLKAEEKADWKITGQFISEKANEAFDWRLGQIEVFPADFKLNVNKKGKFCIETKILKGQKFEDVIERIEYASPDRTGRIYPKVEYEKYIDLRTTKESKIEALTDCTRDYKPVLVEMVSQ